MNIKNEIIKPLSIISISVVAFCYTMAYFSANKKESNDINIINNPITNKVMSDVNNNVIKDCEAQYEIVSKTGDKIEMHVRAGLCAEAYLNAKNEVGYNKWKRIADSLN